MSSADEKRLFTLDAMRGIAAIVVVLHHQKAISTPAGYLAVDFFFALSGLVIAQAYQKRILGGLSVRDFMVQRVVRLYPMFAIGLTFGAARAAQMMLSSGDSHAVLTFVVDSVANGLFLPAPMSGREIFPLNLPAWSLFFELLINFAWATFIVRLPTKALVVVLIVSGLALAGSTAFYHTFDGGFDWSNVGQGLTRVFWSFTAGVLLQRLGWARSKAATTLSILPAMALVVCLVLPLPAAVRPSADYAFAIGVAPLLIIWAAGWQPPHGFMREACRVLGDLSYPLYAIHYPILQLWNKVPAKLHLSPMVSLAIYLPVVCIVSLILARTIDEWIRNWASALWRSRLVA